MASAGRDLADASDVETLTVGAMLEGNGDGGAGAKGGRVGERALVDGKAVVVVGLDAGGFGDVGGSNAGTEGARSGVRPTRSRSVCP